MSQQRLCLWLFSGSQITEEARALNLDVSNSLVMGVGLLFFKGENLGQMPEHHRAPGAEKGCEGRDVFESSRKPFFPPSFRTGGY